MNGFKKKSEHLIPWILPLVAILMWELLATFKLEIIEFLVMVGIENQRIPDLTFIIGFHTIIINFFDKSVIASIWPYILDTVYVMNVSLFIASIIGIPVGMYSASSIKRTKLLIPSIDGLRSIPPIALLPIFILFFGIDWSMKLLFVTFGVVWPIIINTYAAYKNIDQTYLKTARNLRYTNSQIFWNVTIRMALPGIFT